MLALDWKYLAKNTHLLDLHIRHLYTPANTLVSNISFRYGGYW